MSIFLGYEDSKVTEGTLHDHFRNKKSFTRIWNYAGLTRSFQYPISTKTGYTSTVMMVDNPSDEARITLVGIHIDDDFGGLNGTDTLEFQIRYVTITEGSLTQVLNHKTIFTADLSQYTKIVMSDGQGALHNYTFLKVFNLSENISNCRDIKALNIGVRHSIGTIRGNETTLVVAFDNVPD